MLVRPSSDLGRLSGVIDEIDVLRAELTETAAVEDAVLSAVPEIVFHLGWQGVSGGFRNDPEQITKNVSGSLAIVEAAGRAGCHCFVGLGSQAEYGPYSGVLTEDLPTNPQTVYGVSKLCTGKLSEKLCETMGMRYVWLRLLATYGPYDDQRHLIPSIVRKLLEREKPALTPGEQRWDYLYVEDAAEAICAVAAVEEAGGIYNLGSGETNTVRSIAESVRDLVDPDLPLGFGEVPYRHDQVMHLEADVSRLKRATGWAPRTGLAQGLGKTVEWHMARLTA